VCAGGGGASGARAGAGLGRRLTGGDRPWRGRLFRGSLRARGFPRTATPRGVGAAGWIATITIRDRARRRRRV
jgi:hypothetical protein